MGFYGTGGIEKYVEPPPSEGICNDGVDQDGDGYTDSNDPGCTKPFNLDRAEEDVRDSDATWAFSGEPSYDWQSPSLGHAGWYRHAQLAGWDGWGDSVSNSGDDAVVTEQYAENPSGFWAGGSRITKDITYDNASVKSYGGDSMPVSNPTGSGISSYICGNGDRDSGEGDNMQCPEDWGLPDDLGRTESESTSMITNFLSYEHTISSPETGHSETVVNYIMDLEGYEWNDDDTDYIWSLSSNDDYAYTYDEIIYDPDFYTRPGDRDGIWMVYLSEGDDKTIGSVTNHEQKYDDFDHYTYAGEIQTGCSNVGYNETCSSTGSQVCTSNNNRQITEHLLDSNSDTLTADSQKRYTTKNEPYDYNRNSDRLGFQIEVWHYDEKYGSDIDAYECTNDNVDVKTCDTTGTPNAGTCTADKESYYTNDGPKNIPYDYNEYTRTYKYAELVWEEQKVFDTNPAESPRSSKEAMFDEHRNPFSASPIGERHPKYDEISAVSSGGRAYWTADSDRPIQSFSNDPAVSSSSFKVEVDSNLFKSKRDWYGVFDADGTFGGGDSYIPVKQGSVTGDAVDSIFGNETQIVSGDGTSVGAMEGQEADYVSASDYGAESCPGSYGFCVQPVDISTAPLSSWSDPSNAPQMGSGIVSETEGNAHVNASWSVCRLFQEQNGGADNSFLRCQFDHARNYPSGPTPSYRTAIKPFNPANNPVS